MLHNYERTSDGVIRQIEVDPVEYSKEYIESSYSSYGDKPTCMGYLRLGYITGVLGRTPKSLMDVGYGDGSFLKVCKDIIPICAGNDVSGYDVPEGCAQEDNLLAEYEVITFFDVLEHFENIEIVKELNCKYIVISVPNCTYKGDDWFAEWKHRRPNEHLWHFDSKSLIAFMLRMGYMPMHEPVNIEDCIRKNPGEDVNIITCAFEKSL